MLAGTRLDCIPAPVPYLRANPARATGCPAATRSSPCRPDRGRQHRAHRRPRAQCQSGETEPARGAAWCGTAVIAARSCAGTGRAVFRARTVVQSGTGATRVRRHDGGAGRTRPADQRGYRCGASGRRDGAASLVAAALRARLGLALWARCHALVSNSAAVSPIRAGGLVLGGHARSQHPRRAAVEAIWVNPYAQRGEQPARPALATSASVTRLQRRSRRRSRRAQHRHRSSAWHHPSAAA